MTGKQPKPQGRRPKPIPQRRIARRGKAVAGRA